MTMTVKFGPELEQRLRQRSVAEGRPAGELIREALMHYLDAAAPAKPSPFSLGADLFGRFSGPPELAQTRKAAVTDALAAKHAARSAPR